VAYAGHLYPWKGVNVLLEALTRLPYATGLIIGGHPGERDLARTQAEAGRLGLDARVTFTGLVDPGVVASRLADADVLVLPNTKTTLSARYTSPLKLFEYMAAGKPIVASKLASLEEVLEHGQNAWLVEPGDPAALAEGIDTLIHQPELADRIARQAFETAADYDWARRAERLESLLGDVTQNRDPGSAP
jgi:glycosyltransferase involved in cell wall biosynthesis